MTEVLLLLIPGAPLLLLPALLHPATAGPAIRLAPLTLLPGLLAAATGSIDATDLPWLFFGSSLGLNATGRTFLLLAGGLWLAVALFSQGYLQVDPRKQRYWIFFLLTACGNLGLIIAHDLISFYVFFSLMSFAAYGLIVHDDSDFARRAGRVYLALVMLGEVLLFAALALIAAAGDSLLLADVARTVAGAERQNLIIGLLLAAFGIKAGIVPLHIWLPLAHPAAPVPASAVLSGAMIKAGLLGLLQCLPLGLTALVGWSQAILGVGLFMAFYGILFGLLQDRAKAVLAYSSISQMGLPLIAIAIGLGDPGNWTRLLPVISFFCLHHGLAKGALFLGTGMASGAPPCHPQKWLIGTGLLLPALALAGAPLTSGALAKSGLKAFVADNLLLPDGWLLLLLSLAAAGTTLLMIRFFLCLLAAPDPEHAPSPCMWLGWLLPLSAVLAAGWQGLPRGLTLTAEGLSPHPMDHLWPLSVGILLGAGAWYLSRTFAVTVYLPPGDLLIPCEQGLRHLRPRARRLRRPRLPRRLQLRAPFAMQNLPLLLALRHGELTLRRLPVAGVLYLLLLLLLLLAGH